MNRERELVELALYNAHFIYMMKKPGVTTNWRPFHFVFAAQMYGAGKTRLGEEFIGQIGRLLESDNLHIFKKFCPSALLRCLSSLLDILREFRGAERVYHSMVREETITCFCEKIGYKDVSEYILSKCNDIGKPVFFHFDEVGGCSVHELCKLRNQCWESLPQLTPKLLATAFPFFFFSGRGAAYSELGRGNSQICSHWLILEPLKKQHINTILLKSSFGMTRNLTTMRILRQKSWIC